MTPQLRGVATKFEGSFTVRSRTRDPRLGCNDEFEILGVTVVICYETHKHEWRESSPGGAFGTPTDRTERIPTGYVVSTYRYRMK